MTDPETEVARMLAHCGLNWEAACLAFHRNPAAVATASAVQVRQPIYTSSVGRWRHYAAHLGPAVEVLRAAGQMVESDCSEANGTRHFP